MPILEVIHSVRQPFTMDQKKQFAAESVKIFQDVLGTPEGRLRLLYRDVAPTDTIEGLLTDDADQGNQTLST
jgi:hypothetical protein